MLGIRFMALAACGLPLLASAVALGTEPVAEPRPLFNGRDLTGWVGVDGRAEDCWKVEDGVLTCLPKKGAWLRSDEQYGDFNLRLEYRVEPGANGGIYVRVPADGNHHRDNTRLPPAGFEVQLLDDSAAKYANLKDYQHSGSVYDIAGATRRVSRPAGEWNALEINCRGNRVNVIHNSLPIVDIDDHRYPLLALREQKGYLGLQNHGGGVSFRNIKIGPAASKSGFEIEAPRRRGTRRKDASMSLRVPPSPRPRVTLTR
ncbi:MAG: DUF1080 domain-containing protein [Planctomycetaceae bacterium]